MTASLHGRPRLTKDVDVVAIAENDRWPELVEKAEDWGLRPRIGDALEFARTTRVLLLVHEPTRIELDLSFGMLPFENELVRRAEIRKVNRIRFTLASAEDIIVMKALALRPRDVADIESIVELSQELALDRVRGAAQRSPGK